MSQVHARRLKCRKCERVMTVAFFVKHHQAGGELPCRTVPCETCQRPVRDDLYNAGDLHFCTWGCRAQHPVWQCVEGGREEVEEVLDAMDRAKWLPRKYEDQSWSEAG